MAFLNTYREWPFCQPDIQVGGVISPSNFPMKMTKEELFRRFYRVRNWDFSFSMTYEMSRAESYGAFKVTGSITVKGVEKNSFDDERGFVCMGETGLLHLSSWEEWQGRETARKIITGGPDEIAEYETTPDGGFTIMRVKASAADYGFSGVNAFYLRDGDDYLPSLGVSAYPLVGAFPDGGPSWAKSPGDPAYGPVIQSNNPSSLYNSRSIAILLDGGSFTGVIGTREAWDSASFTATINVSPRQFWTFNPNDGGGPCIGVRSGTQLRSIGLITQEGSNLPPTHGLSDGSQHGNSLKASLF